MSNNNEKKNATKERILLAAKKAFTTKGFDGTSVDDIAKEAGVAKSLMYYYFENKDEVFYALMKATMERIVERVVEDHREVVKNTRQESLQYGIKVLIEEIDVMRIAASEALKTRDKTNIIFRIPATVFDELKDKYDFSEDVKARMCLNAVKIVTYLSIRETMADAFSLSENVLDEIFAETF